MANAIDIIINALWKGGGATKAAAGDLQKLGSGAKGAAGDLKGLDGATVSTGRSMKEMAGEFATGAAVLGSAAFAAKQLWNVIGEGASLELAASRFDKLAMSVDSTADAMLGKLRAATSGMISDAQLMQSATSIISLGLADTEDGVIRLARLVGELGWDMQQVIMTFANDSVMRLDALGLSVTDVKERAEAFKKAGMDASKAFDAAVIEAGEAKLRQLGSAADTTAGDIARVAAEWQNLSDNMKRDAVQFVAPVLSALNRRTEIQRDLLRLREEGQITENQFRAAWHRTYSDTLPALENYYQRVRLNTEAVQMHSAKLEEDRRSLGGATAAAKEAAFAYTDVSQALEDYAEQLAVIAVYEDRREGISSSQAHTLEWWEEMEKWVTRTAKAYGPLVAVVDEFETTFGGAFVQALEAGTDATVDWNQELLRTLAPLATTRNEVLGLATDLSGNLDPAMVESAITTAALRAKLEELTAQVVSGEISALEAKDAFLEFQAALAQDYTIALDSTPLSNARDAAYEAIAAIRALDGMSATITVNYGGAHPSSVPYVPGATPVAYNAEGTDYFKGGLTWVGERGPELMALPQGTRIWSSAESQQMAGGGYIDNSVTTHVYGSREAAALGLAQVKQARRARIDQMMGRA